MLFIADSLAQDIVGCGGFVQSSVPLNFERVEVKLYTKQGALKFKTECAPNNGYFLVAVYDKVGFESLDGSKLFCPQQDTFLFKMYLDLNVCSLCAVQCGKQGNFGCVQEEASIVDLSSVFNTLLFFLCVQVPHFPFRTLCKILTGK